MKNRDVGDDMDDKIEWMDAYIELGLGYDQNAWRLDTHTIKEMFLELKAAQGAGELDLETAAGVDNLERIVNKYEYPD